MAHSVWATQPLSGEVDLPFEQASGIVATEASSDAYFATLIRATNEIEHLASHKRYQEMLSTTALLRKKLEQANTVLPPSEGQRAARFLASSRSLDQLSNALHSFMWNGKSEQLFEASDKLVKLMEHIGTLITPGERAGAQAYLRSAKS